MAAATNVIAISRKRAASSVQPSPMWRKYRKKTLLSTINTIASSIDAAIHCRAILRTPVNRISRRFLIERAEPDPTVTLIGRPTSDKINFGAHVLPEAQRYQHYRQVGACGLGS